MSLTAFKRKSIIKYGSKRSGKPPGGVWLLQGPFGHSTQSLQNAINNPENAGFSINGGHRNIGGVGKDMKMSKSGTPYRGTEAIGYGGTFGKYPSAILIRNNDGSEEWTGAVKNSKYYAVVEPVLNSRIINTQGNQYIYIKPSTLSTNGLLKKKYRWAYNGKYPNYWVQPNYTGNQTDTKSQLQYIQNKAASNICNLKVNNVGTYEGYIVNCGPTLCKSGTSTALLKYNNMTRNAPYTKTLYQPVSYTEYNAYITRGCNNPVGIEKPFPYAVTTGKSQTASGTSITKFASGCNTSSIYLSPPAWYTKGPWWYSINKIPPSAIKTPQTQI